MYIAGAKHSFRSFHREVMMLLDIDDLLHIKPDILGKSKNLLDFEQIFAWQERRASLHLQVISGGQTFRPDRGLKDCWNTLFGAIFAFLGAFLAC